MEKNQEILKGTTTVGIMCKDGVVMAADKRATAGNLIVNKKAPKIAEIAESIAVTTAGGVSDAQLLTKLIKAELKLKSFRTGNGATVKEAANLLAGMVYSNIRKMSMIPGIAHFLLGGKDGSGYYLFDIFPDGSLTDCEDYVCSGSGSVMAYGVLETLYHKDMEVDEAIGLAVKCINAALQRDSATGNGVAVLTITDSGMKRVIDKDIQINLSS